jgi:ring-1,2-phenylacetyl-CoA epoxidase subunit PaaE
MDFHSLILKDKINETEDSVSLMFEPGADHPLMKYLPGQYLTLKKRVGREELLRCYSLSSIPGSKQLSITVKKVSKGKVSRYLCETAQVGDEFQLAGPHGRFVIDPDPERRSTYYFFAAGSGITPVFSMINSLLEHEPKSRIHLLYGNRREQDIIFRDKLDHMASRYEGQFVVEYALSKHTSGFLWTKRSDWSGLKGRIDSSMVAEFLQRHPADSTHAAYYLCGPGAFIQDLENHLVHLNIPTSSIHKEYFTLPESESAASSAEASWPLICNVHVTLDHKSFDLMLNPGEKILDGLVRQGLNPPYSCSSGACATCVAKVVSGKVKMDVALGLEEEEVKAGFILTCQARALSEELEINYDI